MGRQGCCMARPQRPLLIPLPQDPLRPPGTHLSVWLRRARASILSLNGRYLHTHAHEQRQGRVAVHVPAGLRRSLVRHARARRLRAARWSRPLPWTLTPNHHPPASAPASQLERGQRGPKCREVVRADVGADGARREHHDLRAGRGTNIIEYKTS